MARIWTEGFENAPYIPNGTFQYNGLEIKSANSSSNNHAVSTKARKNGYSMCVGGSVSSGYYYYSSKSLPNLDEVYCRFWFAPSSASAVSIGHQNIIASINSSSTKLVYIKYSKVTDISSTGNNEYCLSLYDKTNTLLWTSRILKEGNFCKIDLHYKINTSTNLVNLDCKLNDEFVIQTTSTDGEQNLITSFDFGSLDKINSGSIYYYFDDMAINDTASTVNNSWCGNGHCEALVPIANGSTIQFTPSTGSNYTCIDEIPFNSTDYNSTTTDGAIDLFSMTKLISKGYASGTKVNAIKIHYGSRYVDSPMDIIPYAKIKNTDYELTPKVIFSTSFKSNFSHLELNPNTNAVFTVDDIDNNEYGYKSIVGV